MLLGSIHNTRMLLGSIQNIRMLLGSIHNIRMLLGSIHNIRILLGSIHNNRMLLGSIYNTTMLLISIHNKHNAQLQRTYPSTKIMGEFSTNSRIFTPKWISIISIVLVGKNTLKCRSHAMVLSIIFRPHKKYKKNMWKITPLGSWWP